MRTGGWRISRTLGAMLLLSCSGEVVGAPPELPVELTDAPGPRRMALLTRAQYLNTLADLFPDTLTLPTAEDLPADIHIDGFASVGATTSTASSTSVEQYEAAALGVASRLIGRCVYHSDSSQPVCDGWRQRRADFLGCEDGPPSEACVSDWIERFGRLAWRRPVNEAETEAMLALFKEVAQRFTDPWRGMEFVLVAFLQSPYLLYRIEYGEVDPEGEHWRYTAHEMASRLAFALWNRSPDEALLDAAESGELLDDTGLAAQIERMLEDPRALWGMRQFVDEYLFLERVAVIGKDAATYPQFTDELRISMQEELRKLFEATVFVEESSFLDLFDTRETYLDPHLAAFYGVTGPERGWTKSTFPEGAQRDGWLSRPATLVANSHPVRTSPTLRGLFVRQNILCQSVGAPPPNVPNKLEEPHDGSPMTLRQQLEDLHATDSACAGCHQRMDPIGFAFENFDAIGRYRDLDTGLPVDAHTELDGTSVNGASELGAALKAHPDTASCMVKRLFRYTTGRIEVPSEHKSLESLGQRFAVDGYRVKTLLVELLLSDAFRKVQTPKENQP
jgi:hypothetical protein